MSSIDENKDLIDKILDAKADIALLKIKKRVLLEEIHRQYLEGQIEPRKRAKQISERINQQRKTLDKNSDPNATSLSPKA